VNILISVCETVDRNSDLCSSVNFVKIFRVLSG
jgi:hypothetical protein